MLLARRKRARKKERERMVSTLAYNTMISNVNEFNMCLKLCSRVVRVKLCSRGGSVNYARIMSNLARRFVFTTKVNAKAFY